MAAPLPALPSPTATAHCKWALLFYSVVLHFACGFFFWLWAMDITVVRGGGDSGVLVFVPAYLGGLVGLRIWVLVFGANKRGFSAASGAPERSNARSDEAEDTRALSATLGAQSVSTSSADSVASVTGVAPDMDGAAPDPGPGTMTSMRREGQLRLARARARDALGTKTNHDANSADADTRGGHQAENLDAFTTLRQDGKGSFMADNFHLYACVQQPGWWARLLITAHILITLAYAGGALLTDRLERGETWRVYCWTCAAVWCLSGLHIFLLPVGGTSLYGTLKLLVLREQ